MDCHRPLAFAMTNVAKSCKFFFIFLSINKRIVVYGLLRRFTPRNDKETKDSTPHTVIARLWKSRGNLGMGYHDSQTKLVIARTEGSWQSQYGIQFYLFMEFFFFLFLYLLFVACGGLPPFVRGEVAKQQGGWEKN